jgi:hypothetical protein
MGNGWIYVLLCPGSLIGIIFILRKGDVMSILLESIYTFVKLNAISELPYDWPEGEESERD